MDKERRERCESAAAAAAKAEEDSRRERDRAEEEGRRARTEAEEGRRRAEEAVEKVQADFDALNQVYMGVDSLVGENMHVADVFSYDSLPWKSFHKRKVTKYTFFMQVPITGVLANKLNDAISLPRCFFLQLAILDYIQYLKLTKFKFTHFPLFSLRRPRIAPSP